MQLQINGNMLITYLCMLRSTMGNIIDIKKKWYFIIIICVRTIFKYITRNFTETGNPKQGGAVQHEDQFW